MQTYHLVGLQQKSFPSLEGSTAVLNSSISLNPLSGCALLMGREEGVLNTHKPKFSLCLS